MGTCIILEKKTISQVCVNIITCIWKESGDQDTRVNKYVHLKDAFEKEWDKFAKNMRLKTNAYTNTATKENIS